MLNNERRFDLDWLRVGTIMMVFLYHSSLFFWTGWWYIKNPQTNAVTDIFDNILGIWMMPLLFLVAGSAAWFSLKQRSGSEFIRERTFRLVVPLLFGILILIPPVTYLDRIMRGYFNGSFLQYFPHFFQGVYSLTGPSKGDIHTAHLWFLLYLFFIALIATPIISRLSAGRGRKAIDWLARFTTKPGVIYLYALPPVLISLALAPISSRTYMFVGDWSYDLCALCLFLFGFIYCMDERFWNAVERHRTWSLGIALAMVISWIFLWVNKVDTTASYSLSSLPFTVLWVCTTWFCMLAILGYARRYLNFSNRFLAYASQASLPFYILHVTVLVTIGFFVVRWNIAPWVKYLSIVAISFSAIILIYEFIIKRVNVIRFLFGMRTLSKRVKTEPVRNIGVS
jgi:glucan biosynthesis protein C